MVRIAELNAMRVMEEMDKKKVFGDAVLAGVKAPVKGAAALVTEPVETTTNIVKGTGRFLSNLGRSIVSDDPHQDNALKVALGYDTTKRVFAYDLRINPYSDYQPVISMLGSISQASVAGGLTPRAAMAAIDSDVVTVMRISATAEGMRKLVRDNPPGELQKINTAKLAEMGVSTPMIEALLSNYIYDPQEQTLLVGELESLKGVKGREEFVAAATLASDRQAAGPPGNCGSPGGWMQAGGRCWSNPAGRSWKTLINGSCRSSASSRPAPLQTQPRLENLFFVGSIILNRIGRT